ncbi:DegT/DnrJ/EryC1/StrS aminotransferase (modular protein) [uncultured delta proteobacterium]|uniref:DegT/DnrJ/EryC1/StrS aminotransferase (Modular protein) n=1 Tax=uncultured delta proteobacterium TaxID=34034 RepID=A0A212JWU3_9DELT|nr:DegT/DnrJ/EryC1/StrS aminotransferase (modular protein) [uncultured delta proteobacterium]
MLNLSECSPKELFLPEELDLVVKYLYAKDILSPCGSDVYRSLYLRHILMRTRGIEGVNTNWRLSRPKNTVEDYDQAFRELVASMRQQGFIRENFIPVTTDGHLLAGCHRIAAAAALGIPLFTRVEEKIQKREWDFSWFVKHGFPQDDLLRILRGYADLLPESSTMFIVWPPMLRFAGHIREYIKKHLDIVGEIELSFEDNYIALSHLLYDMYYYTGKMGTISDNDAITRKITLFHGVEQKIVVFLATNIKNNKEQDIFDLSTRMKEDLRLSFDFHIPKDTYASLHAASSEDELRHMARLVLSPNNLKYLRLRLLQGIHPRLTELCETAKRVCAQHGISSNDICVVGSGPLGVLGLLEPGDFDCIAVSSERARWEDDLVYLHDDFMLVKKGFHKKQDGEALADDTIIRCPEWHFVYNGLKFANLDIIKDKKNVSRRPKDVLHLETIRLFENMLGLYDKEKILKDRITAEAIKRNLGIAALARTSMAEVQGPVHVTRAAVPDLAVYNRYLHHIFQSGHFTNNGQFAAGLEQRLANDLRAPRFALCANGTLALQLAVRAAGLAGKTVITTPFSYVATMTALLAEGCTPVFADIDEETLCLDPATMEERIAPETAGIVPVHVYGNMCDVEALTALSDRHGLPVVYDGAHAFGCEYMGKSLLDFGDYTACSFHSTQVFHTAEGGGVVSATDAGDAAIRLLRAFGHSGEEYQLAGINAKMSELHAAMGLSLIDTVDENIRQRGIVSGLYDAALRWGALRRPARRPEMTYNYAYYPVIFPDEDALLRVAGRLRERNIFPRRYFYPALNTLPYLPKRQSCPVAESVAPRVLCLPLYAGLDTAIVEYIARTINNAL